MVISSDSSFKYKCILYILPSFSIILLIIIKIILISLERSLLLGTLMHYHAYIEGSCVRLSSHWTVPPFLIQSLLTPIFVHLLFQISFLSPIGRFRKSCVIRSCLLLTVYYHSFILLSTILCNIFYFSFFIPFFFKLCILFTSCVLWSTGIRKILIINGITIINHTSGSATMTPVYPSPCMAFLTTQITAVT